MKQKIIVASISILLGAGTVIAGGVDKRAMKTTGPTSTAISEGYVTDSKGRLVLDGNGQCVRTISWKPALAIPQCDATARVARKARTTRPSIAVVEKTEPAKAKSDPRFVTVSLQAGALFDVDKSNLKARGKEKLNILARKLKETITTETVEIAGHTDSTGSDSYNQRLSQRRAEAVKAYLVSRGVSSDKVKTIGFGETKPIASNKTSSGRQANRRVEVRIRATKQLN